MTKTKTVTAPDAVPTAGNRKSNYDTIKIKRKQVIENFEKFNAKTCSKIFKAFEMTK